MPDVESFVYSEMCRKMDEFQTLTGNNPNKVSPKLTALKVSLAQAKAGTEKLLDTPTGANSTLLSYVNTRIEALDAERKEV